jgi:hypothetical protein
MDCLAAHDREGYARHFIGERDGDKLEGLALHEPLHPGSQRVVMRRHRSSRSRRMSRPQLPKQWGGRLRVT